MSKNTTSFWTRRTEGVDGSFRPQLTSLIDVMTILLVFLIKSFSVEGSLLTPSPDLELPVSSSKKPPQPRFTVEITKSSIFADGKEIATLDTIQNRDSLLIPSLHEWMLIQKSSYHNAKHENEILIQADKDIAFNVIKCVMFTCSKAGYIDFSVLVLQEE